MRHSPTMSEYISTSEGVDVRSRAEELGLQSPERFSIVPSGLSKAESVDDLLHQDEAITIRKVINREGIEETPIDKDVSLDTYHARSAEFIGPVIYFSAKFLMDNWSGVVSIILGIRSYLLLRNAKNVTMSFNCESPGGENVLVEYEGPAENLDDVLDTISEVKSQDIDQEGSSMEEESSEND